MTMFCSITLGLALCIWEDNSGMPLSGPHTFHSLIHSGFILDMNKIFFYVLVVCLAGVIGNLNCSQKCVLRGDRYDSPVL